MLVQCSVITYRIIYIYSSLNLLYAVMSINKYLYLYSFQFEKNREKEFTERRNVCGYCIFFLELSTKLFNGPNTDFFVKLNHIWILITLFRLVSKGTNLEVYPPLSLFSFRPLVILIYPRWCSPTRKIYQLLEFKFSSEINEKS